MKPLNAYVRVAQHNSKQEFLSALPDPVLVLKPFAVLGGSRVDTIVVGGGQAQSEHHDGVLPTVARVRKQEGVNAFALMVTVGRTSNNDIVVSADGISKFHAYFSKKQNDEVTLVDGGSTNGTFVRGKRLEKHGKATINSGDLVGFAEIKGFYYSAETFYDLLQDVDEHPWKAFVI